MKRAWRIILPIRGMLLVALHVFSFTAAFWVAFLLRFDFKIPESGYQTFWATIPWLLMLKFAVFYLSGNYHGWLRYVTFSDLVALLRAATIAQAVLIAFDFILFPQSQIPRSVLILDWGLTVLFLGAMRSSWRLSREQFAPWLKSTQSGSAGLRRALIVGANHQGAAMATIIHADRRLPYRVVGFLDPRDANVGSSLGGLPVLGTTREAVQVAQECAAKDLLVIADAMPGRDLRGFMDRCLDAGLQIKVIPAVMHMLHGKGGGRADAIQVRNIEIADLLRRDPVALDSEAIGKMLDGKAVMVTGAGGSIGSEICRQILAFCPSALILVERAENALFHIDLELRAQFPAANVLPCIADILDTERLQAIFMRYKPQVVFHAAAHKHVPMMERNVGEALKNNVFGTRCVAEAAHQNRVETFVLISSDKAVNPTSVMGASKQLAERFVHALSQESATRFVTVRFGNVLGSTGSVVPIFQEQIRAGGPITITDPRMERFFMTIPEASQLVLQAASMGRGGEIFVLEMGQPVKIVELAQDLIRLSGLTLEDIAIEFTGRRPGEKLYEELYQEDEQRLPTSHPKVQVSYHRPFELAEVIQSMDEFWPLVHGPEAELRVHLKNSIPEFIETNDEPEQHQAASSAAVHGEASSADDSGATLKNRNGASPQ